ncbi:OmpA family protein [Vibrio cyclitrophicus]|uniref:OmpA family protein n=1 Tax=unclassified Vibrio TaxID=2614977 RepID=UPI002070CDEF|nr:MULTISPECIES: OmpA family protein [Vibrio]MCX2758024.1 OmpA family protein [Vibrio sp. 14G-20]MCX2775187.1 OmpA family protein [Vibrio sp. Sgm 22]UPR50405.1 OmpA family protein [Vibrio cyclitrophicus]UPR54516.1 OmpA family protein [Vibrio cyclitrophicus]
MKRLSKIMCAVVAASGLAAAPSIAATTYVGAKVGMGWLDSACVAGAKCDDDAIGAGIYSGYNFNEKFGIELSSDFLGDYKTSFTKNGTTAAFSDPLIAISLTPMYRLPVQQEFDVFFKAGPAYISHGGEDDVVLTAGIGVEKQLSSDWALRVEYQYFDDFDDNYVQDLNSNLLSVGVSYNFGTGNTTASAAAAAASAVAVTQAPSEQITEPAVIEEKTTVIVTQAQTESHSQEMFATNSTELSTDGKIALMPLVEVLKEHPQSTIEVVGHTDSTGAAEYNMMISKKRAAAVAAYIEEQGIEADRITATGEGEENPVASNDTAEGRAQNRRVDTTIPAFEYQQEVKVEEVIVETAE